MDISKIFRSSANRVREGSTAKQNLSVDETTRQNIERYRHYSQLELDARLEELDQEWDIEKALELNASALALGGTVLGALVDKRWFILPGIVSGFLMQHALQGWCPPLPVLRKLGYRTRKEIDEERFALKILRGDFEDLSSASSASELLLGVRS